MGVRLQPRKPMHLPQHRSNGCVTAMVGQVLQVFEQVDTPDLEAIEEAAGLESPDAPMYDPDAYFYLLDRGFSYVSYTTTSSEGFLDEGVEYLRKNFGSDWGDEHESFFTPEHVLHLQDLTRTDMARKVPFRASGRLEEIERAATIGDLLSLLHQGCVVDVTLDRGTELVQHAGLLVPHEEHPDLSAVWLYSPNRFGPTLSVMPLERLIGQVRLDRDVTGIWLTS